MSRAGQCQARQRSNHGVIPGISRIRMVTLWEIMWKPTLVTHLLNSAASAAFACHSSLSSTRHHSRSSYGLGDPLTTVKQKCTLLYENQTKTDNTLCERADQRLEGLRKAGDD